MAATVIIPALNPDERLLDLVRELRTLQPNLQILVVDDGSSTASGRVFGHLKFLDDCIVCRHPENYGKGAAIKTGIDHILTHFPGCTGFLTADADGQHRGSDIIKVAKAMEQYPDQLVLGTRDFDGGQVPFKSRWGNRVTSAVFRRVTGTACPDTQTGLRGIPAAYGLFALEVPGERFEYEMNFLLSAVGVGIPLHMEPIETVYLNRNSSSHFRPVRDALRIYGTIGKYAVYTLFHRSTQRRKELFRSLWSQPEQPENKAAV